MDLTTAEAILPEKHRWRGAGDPRRASVTSSCRARLQMGARLLSALLLTACARRPGGGGPPQPTPPAMVHAVIPLPSNIELARGEYFTLDSATQVVVDATESADVERIASEFAAMIRVHPVNAPLGTPALRGLHTVTARRLAGGERVPARSIYFHRDPGQSALGAEGYEVTVGQAGVTVVAREPAGLFYGYQTLRQLLPASVEHRDALGRTMRVPLGRITDVPRFSWRGAMLDVARHFLGAEDVKRYIDLMAFYKLNRLHLHLSDDQGWRIEVKSWPNLARFAGQSQVGGAAGGYYTQEQFADLVAYARSRFVEVIPEIEMPAHINAALSAYGELNCDGVPTPAYTGINVGFSALCVQRDGVYRFVDDVVREVGALVPTPWFHIGGDEVQKLTHDQYARFIEHVEQIVLAHDKVMIGWGEIATTNVTPKAIAQHWTKDSLYLHVSRGGRVILSPGSRTYLDMKYDSSTVTGLMWAGLISVQTAYDWEPSTLLPGIAENAMLGVEAPLWSETLEKLSDFEYMAFPRLIAIAEIGWSPAASRRWSEFRWRLGAHGGRLRALGVNFYPDPGVPWSR